MTVPPQRGVFLSYRREEAGYAAGRLADRIATRFDNTRVFIDVDSVPAGEDFVEAIQRAVADCDVLLAFIGRQWTGMVDDGRRRRLDDPDDLVVLELKEALERDIHVVPVLLDGATMPRPDELPSALRPLSRRNAVRVDAESFRRDADALLEQLTPLLLPGRPEPTRTASGSTGQGAAVARREPVRLVPAWGRWKWAAGAAIAVVLAVTSTVLLSHRPARDDHQRPGEFGLVRINFQSPDAETPSGYLPDFGEPYGKKPPHSPGAGLSYGWVYEGTTVPVSIISQGRERNSNEDQRLDTLVHMEAWDPALRKTVSAAWELEVPKGRYAVTVSVGDKAHNSVNYINVEGVTAIKRFISSDNEEYQENTVAVDVTDGRLTIDSRGGENTKINYATVKQL
jgi:hypothetical protein